MFLGTNNKSCIWTLCYCNSPKLFITILLVDTHGLKAADQVEQLQDEAQLLLADYVWSRLPVQPARFGKILLSVAALRSLAEKPIDQLFFSAVPGKDMFESILSQVISSN